MLPRPDAKTILTVKDASKKLKDSLRRAFQAQVVLDHWQAVCEWTKTMRWDGIPPNVFMIDKIYERGAKLSKHELKPYSQRLLRTPNIEKWSMVIEQQKLLDIFWRKPWPVPNGALANASCSGFV